MQVPDGPEYIHISHLQFLVFQRSEHTIKLEVCMGIRIPMGMGNSCCATNGNGNRNGN